MDSIRQKISDALRYVKSVFGEQIKQNTEAKQKFNKLLLKSKSTKEKKLSKLNAKVTEFCSKFKSNEKKPAPRTNKSNLKKRDAKAASKTDAKQRKGVKFNDVVETHHIGERRWNDYKNKDLKKGTFTKEEMDLLMNALCTFVSQQDTDDPNELITILCNKSKQELPK